MNITDAKKWAEKELKYLEGRILFKTRNRSEPWSGPSPWRRRLLLDLVEARDAIEALTTHARWYGDGCEKDEMKPISDFRIDTVECDAELFEHIPAEARKLIEAYWTPLPSPPGKIRYEIPVYRWEEIEPLLTGHATPSGGTAPTTDNK